jgi:hypothetical protein
MYIQNLANGIENKHGQNESASFVILLLDFFIRYPFDEIWRQSEQLKNINRIIKLHLHKK